MRKLLLFIAIIGVSFTMIGCGGVTFAINEVNKYWVGDTKKELIKRKQILNSGQYNKNNWTRWDFILYTMSAAYYTYEIERPINGFVIFEPKNEKAREKLKRGKNLYKWEDCYIKKISRWYYIDIQMLPRKTERGKQIAKAFKDSYYYTIRKTLDRINKDFNETFKECKNLSECPKSAEEKNNTIIVKFIETAPPPKTEDEIYGKLVYIDTYNNKVVRTADFHFIPECMYYHILPKSTIKKLNLSKSEYERLEKIRKELYEIRRHYSYRVEKREKELLKKSCIKIPEKIIKTDFKIIYTKETGWERGEYITLPEKLLYGIQKDIVRSALANWKTGTYGKFWKINPIEPHKDLLKEVTKEWFERYHLPMRVFPEDLKIKD
ncbi:hypothetical protein [Persephonella sp.]|uniref:hypothetical protein n=1 Tax=Persephonella sp. TaxID=2060922 RepID=UPI0025F06CD5|nr:hypothetical protein [Persephonella sp.]